jgi:type IV pilus assembly protein PilN
MIRINLLSTEKRVEKAAAAAAAAAAPVRAPISPLYLALGLAGLAALLIAGGLYLWQSSQLTKLEAEITELQAKEKQLQTVKAQVDAFELKKKTLTEKVNLIERLKAEQSSPVHLLDEVSKALPDLVWLTNLDQTGTEIRLTGESSSFTSVADFITNLQRSGWFSTVELVSSDEQTAQGSTQSIVKFVLRAPFVNPEVVAKTPASPAPAPAVRKS